jgi:tyrosyl-tRNA synthetase
MAILKDIDKQLEVIRRGTVEIISEGNLRESIENSIRSNTPLIVKAGFDPSAPDIHLGHTVLLRKMRHFQDLGHKVVFLIGDHTAMIGDPSGAVKTRPQLTRAEVRKNARTYKQQIAAVLNIKKLNICFNSEWLDKMKSTEIAQLVSKYSVSRMLERDDFSKRYKQQKPISMLEFFYPLLQGYDSVHLKADIELGGTDQKFNLLVGRDIQNSYGQKPQVVITMPLLEGTDGVQKMSKSYGNYIGIDEPAADMFGKIMSISDEMMLKYYELLTDMDLFSVKALHPMEAKKNLAADIVRQYHGRRAAKKAQANFEKTFQKRDHFSGVEVEPVILPANAAPAEGLLLSDLLCSKQEWVKSRSDFRRLVSQGAITVNGERVSDIQYRLECDKEYRIRVGKTKFQKVVLKRP